MGKEIPLDRHEAQDRIQKIPVTMADLLEEQLKRRMLVPDLTPTGGVWPFTPDRRTGYLYK